MPDKVRVRVAGRSFGFRGERYAHGDELEVPEDTLDHHPRTLEPLQSPTTESEDDEGNPGADSSTDEEDGLDPSEYTLTELEGELEDADADADTLHERESEGDDRVGAHEMIDSLAED